VITISFTWCIKILSKEERKREREREMPKKSRKTSKSSSFEFWNVITYVVVVAMSVVAGYTFNPPVVSKKILFRSLERAASITKSSSSKVLVGTNSNIDLIVNARDLFEALPDVNPPDEAKNEEQISNLNQLTSTFAHFFNQGSAAERFVTDKTLFQNLVNIAQSLDSRIERAGGNACLMGNRFALDGYETILCGQASKQLRSHLHKNVRVINDADDHDSVHLILEYAKDETFGDFVSPRANRFIVTPVKDVRPSDLNALRDGLLEEKPSLLVLSGLHLLERTKQMSDRIKSVASVLNVVNDRDFPVHVELASLNDDELTAKIESSIMSKADSVGLNEQELASLYRVMGGKVSGLPLSKPISNKKKNKKKNGKKGNLIAVAKERALDIVSSVRDWRIVRAVMSKIMGEDFENKNDEQEMAKERTTDTKQQSSPLVGNKPDVAAVSNAIAYILNRPSHSVSRLHFHSLGYHIIALKKSSKAWRDKNARASVARGSIRATMQACDVSKESELHGDDLELPQGLTINVGSHENPNHLEITRENSVLRYDIQGVTFFYAPVLVCKEPKVTVGLGDAISASALGAHI